VRHAGSRIGSYHQDGWNRLVKVEYDTDTRAEHRYNGLNWRVVKLADTSSPPDTSLNQKRLMYYSGHGSWQLLEERMGLADGRLSSTDNVVGYAGYVFNAEIAGGGLYAVRHRTYDVDLSRWMQRDPLGYVDGMGLYEYVRSQSTTYLDPFGLLVDFCDPDTGCNPPSRPSAPIGPGLPGPPGILDPLDFDPAGRHRLDQTCEMLLRTIEHLRKRIQEYNDKCGNGRWPRGPRYIPVPDPVPMPQPAPKPMPRVVPPHTLPPVIPTPPKPKFPWRLPGRIPVPAFPSFPVFPIIPEFLPGYRPPMEGDPRYPQMVHADHMPSCSHC
jgi:RHS repeat-associated protein